MYSQDTHHSLIMTRKDTTRIPQSTSYLFRIAKGTAQYRAKTEQQRSRDSTDYTGVMLHRWFTSLPVAAHVHEVDGFETCPLPRPLEPPLGEP